VPIRDPKVYTVVAVDDELRDHELSESSEESGERG
jgi:hypothetical protein